MRVVVGLDSWCWVRIIHIKKGARSVSEQHRSRPSRRAPDSRDQDSRYQDFHPASQIRIVLEGFCGEVTVSDHCRREGIKPGVVYAWTKDPSASSGDAAWKRGKSVSPGTR